MPPREPLDAAGNRIFGKWAHPAQVRDLRRIRPSEPRGRRGRRTRRALARFAFV